MTDAVTPREKSPWLHQSRPPEVVRIHAGEVDEVWRGVGQDGADTSPWVLFLVFPHSNVIRLNPPVFLANFATTSYPEAGSYWLIAFGLGLLVVLAWNCWGALREGAHQPRGQQP